MFGGRARTISFIRDLLLRFLRHLVWIYLEGKMMLFLPNESPYQDVLKEFIELICLRAVKPSIVNPPNSTLLLGAKWKIGRAHV